MEDIGHKCGVAAMIDLSGQSNVVPDVAEMLKLLQHRGDAGAGLAWMTESEATIHRTIATYKSTGLVSDILSLENLHAQGAYSSMCIGQDRYATNGSHDECQLQPFNYGDFAFVWNGNVADYERQRQFLAESGITPRFGGDTEILGCMMGEAMLRGELKDIRKIFQRALSEIDGAFNPIVMTKNGLSAVRDRHGFHPLVYARHSSKPLIAIASENTAIHQLPSWSNAEILNVEPGQLIEVNAKSQHINVHSLWAAEPQLCFFETVYFADHRTTIDGVSVANVRYETGKILAEMDGDRPNTDIVVPVPESAKIAASAYGDKRNLRRVDVIKKNADIGRSFMAFSPDARAEKARLKYDIDAQLLGGIDGRAIVLIDDSLVRGTTMKELIKNLRAKGAGEIHLRLASPPIMAPCFYGIDFPTVSELLVRRYHNGPLQDGDVLPPDVLSAIATDLQLHSIKYLPVSSIPRALGREASQICMACLTTNYPTPDGQRLYDIQDCTHGEKRTVLQRHLEEDDE